MNSEMVNSIIMAAFHAQGDTTQDLNDDDLPLAQPPNIYSQTSTPVFKYYA